MNKKDICEASSGRVSEILLTRFERSYQEVGVVASFGLRGLSVSLCTPEDTASLLWLGALGASCLY